MVQLAIKGHETRGKEVIELLEMMGGKNYVNHSGNRNVLYFIHNSGEILADFVCLGSNYFTLEEFEKKFPYKIGDKVECRNKVWKIENIKWDKDKNQVLYALYRNDRFVNAYVNELRPYKEETMEERKYDDLRLDVDQDDKLATEATIDGNKIIPPENYLIGKITRVDNGMLVEFVKKQPVYPNTYEECCNVIGCNPKMVLGTMPVRYNILVKLEKLLICRDAYWKIAGEQMGLGKSWKPDWNNPEEKRYCIVNIEGDINLPEKILTKWILKVTNKILVFPTEEMRDAFYDNFKELIEKCKELL